MGKINWKVLIVSFVIVYAVAAIGSIFTTNSVKSNWYNSIKPSITPPNWVFPIVWNVLFFLIALSLYFVWSSKNSGKQQKEKIVEVYGINFFLNVLWSVFYFQLKIPLIAFFEILLLWFSIIAMLSVSLKIDKKAFYLLIPYFLWVSFAIILNYLSI